MGDVPLGIAESEVVAAFTEEEVDRAGFVGGEEDEVTAGIDLLRGNAVFLWVERIVAEMPSADLDGKGIGIENFNPVGKIAIGVGESCFVVGQEFGDDRVE